MTTFPNTLLLRGPRPIVVDPGLHLQNEPVLRALEARGLSPPTSTLCLTHAHLDHAGGCTSSPRPRHRARAGGAAPYWVLVAGFLELLPLKRLAGEAGEVTPGLTGRSRPAIRGRVSLCVATAEGRTVICGDTVGPPGTTSTPCGRPRGSGAGAAGVLAATALPGSPTR